MSDEQEILRLAKERADEEAQQIILQAQIDSVHAKTIAKATTEAERIRNTGLAKKTLDGLTIAKWVVIVLFWPVALPLWIAWKLFKMYKKSR
jgi:hypothetical protein